MIHMIRVLITGAGAVLGQEIFQSLKLTSRIPSLFIGFADPSPSAVGRYWADLAHDIPFASSEGYISALISILKLHNYDILIPGTDVELPKISQYRELIESETGCKVIVSSPSVIDIANDKYLTYSFLNAHGFVPPSSWTQDDLLKTDLDTLPYPLIVKPRNGARSIGVSRVESSVQLMSAIKSTDFPVAQECIGTINDEYTAGTFTLGGHCFSTIILKRSLRDGNTWTAQVVNDKSLQRSISDIAEALNPFGPCNFQFRLDGSGIPRIFEINARFSGTTYMRTLSGFDEVVWSVLHATGSISDISFPSSFKELFFMRSFAVTSINTSILTT